MLTRQSRLRSLSQTASSHAPASIIGQGLSG